MPNIISLTGPFFSAPDNSTIDCMIELETFLGPVPFTASAHDVEKHGRQIFEMLLSGDYGPVAPYTPPPEPAPELPVSLAPANLTGPPSVM